jgi:LEA14-like dessication related protein
MKNILLLGGAAAALLYFLKQKRAAGENLRVEPLDIAIDSARSSSSFWTRIYYNVKLKLINTESASVNVSAINLNVLVNNTPFGSINNTTGFIVNAGSERIVNLDASFSSLGIIEAIRDLIADGLRFKVDVSGYVDTDLGRIAVNFSKNIGGSGIGAPKNNKVKFKYDDKVYSYQNPSKAGYVRFIKESSNPDYDHQYKLALFDDNGYSYSSNWINEKSLSKRKLK